MANTTGKKFAGREKGTPNKRSENLLMEARELGADPAQFLISVMLGDAHEFYEDEKAKIDFETRMKAAEVLMPYMYGKRKPVDSKGDDSESLVSLFLGQLNDRV